MNDLFQDNCVSMNNGVYVLQDDSELENQAQTNDAFSKKWLSYSQEELQEQQKLFEFQKKWYLTLYGFENELALADFLASCDTVLDAGCGLGYKAKWFADLSPKTQIVGMDFSDAIYVANDRYASTTNLSFVKGDIADTHFKDNAFSYVSCDQVIHHTEDVAKTYSELTRIIEPNGQFAVYMYAKKALPRELLDEHFRTATKSFSHEQLVELSEQLTELGKLLSEQKIMLDFPDISLLGIKGGQMDLQRFIYWNFIKCFWNEDLGYPTSVSTNYDWYAPSNATRYSIDEFLNFATKNGLTNVFVHSEDACHSGRFMK